MKISKIMNLILSPLQNNHMLAQAELRKDVNLFARCHLFVHLNEGFNGYTADQVRHCWQTRAMAPYMRYRIQAEQAKTTIVANRVLYDGEVVSPNYETYEEAARAESTIVHGVLAGMEPYEILCWKGSKK